jgi:hypothetical protein
MKFFMAGVSRFLCRWMTASGSVGPPSVNGTAASRWAATSARTSASGKIAMPSPCSTWSNSWRGSNRWRCQPGTFFKKGDQRLLRMADEHQPFVAERVRGQPAPPARIADQAEIHRVRQHLLMHAVNEAVADADFDPGMNPLKLGQHGRQLVQADAVAGGQLDGCR